MKKTILSLALLSMAFTTVAQTPNMIDPNSKTKNLNEETYYRWASFSDETPLENMLKLKIPIMVIAGGKDLWGSFIMNTDYVKI